MEVVAGEAKMTQSQSTAPPSGSSQSNGRGRLSTANYNTGRTPMVNRAQSGMTSALWRGREAGEASQSPKK